MLKRLTDILISLVAGVLLLPLMLVLALLVRKNLGSPVLFRQERPGLNGKPFMLLKFRTMLDTRDEHGRIRPDAERLTPFGSWLRRSSLDELPEIWNILKGEMSLVGPRPLLMEYLPLYNEHQSRRHEVRPGLTGWAQISGRNTLSWEEKFELDVWYIDNRTWLLDLKILLLTVVRTLNTDSVSAQGEATMYRFRGSDKGPPKC